MRKLIRRLTAAVVAVVAVVAVTAGPAHAALTYHYAVGEQTGLVADGAAVNLTVESPYVSGAHDGSNAHSLAELLVYSADRKDRIEIGWRKAATGTPTFFVYHAINGVGQGYNLCTDYAAEPFNAGATIPTVMVGDKVNPPRFQIIHSGTSWWVAFNAKWVCSFPDTVWTSAGRTFNKVNIVMAYGEIASTLVGTPCSDMGDGQPASSGTAARIGSYSLQGQTSGPAAGFGVYTQPSTAGITTSVVTATTFRYGWAGYSATNTLPGVQGGC